jgi:hypothetical protein
VIAEFNPDEPGKTQLKYYAPGLGGIRTGWRGKNEKEREELELTSHVTLSDAELASVDQSVVGEEKRAYSRRPQYSSRPRRCRKAEPTQDGTLSRRVVMNRDEAPGELMLLMTTSRRTFVL